MAKLDQNSFRNWNDGDVMKEVDYEQERSMIITAVNAIDDEVKSNKITQDGIANRLTTAEADIDSLETRATSSESRLTAAEGNISTNIEDIDYLQSKFGSGLATSINDYTWTATEGQTMFTLPSEQNYGPGSNSLEVIVGGVPQTNIDEISMTEFALPEGVPAGTEVYARWFQGVGLIGEDLLPSVTQLPDYSTAVDERIGNLLKTVTVIKPTMTTQEIQNLLNNGGTFKFTSGIYNLEFNYFDYKYPSCIDIKSNSEVFFEKGAILKCPINTLAGYQVVSIDSVENVILQSPYIIGDRTGVRDNSAGAYGHGIAIRGSKNVVLNDAFVRDCWGDGLVIHRNNARTIMYSENVTINNFYADNNRRQGISVISVKGLRMKNLHIKNTNGASPSAGIDFEPNGAYEKLEDIVVDNVYTENNQRGILIFLSNFAEVDVFSDIKIKNHTDVGSAVNVEIKGESETGIISGTILFEYPIWKKSKFGVCSIGWNGNNKGKIKVIEPTVIDPNTTNGTSHENFSTFKLTSSNVLGNIEIIKPDCYSVEGFKSPNMLYVMANTVKNVTLVNPLNKFDGTEYRIGLGGVTVEDRYNLFEKSLTYHTTTIGSAYSSPIHNAEYNANVTVNLPDTILPTYPPFTVEARNPNYKIFVKPTANSKILPLGALGQQLVLNYGSSITLRRLDATTWQIVNVIGNVTIQE